MVDFAIKEEEPPEAHNCFRGFFLYHMDIIIIYHIQPYYSI